MVRRMFWMAVIVMATVSAVGQQKETQQVSEDKAAAPKSAAADTKAKRASTTEVKLARSILETAEAESGKFDPATHSALCYQTARGYLSFDKAEAKSILHRCLTATQEIEGRDEVKHRLQGWIANELLKFGPQTAEEILPQVQGRARSTVRSALIQDYVKAKNFDRAIALVNEVRPESEDFPYGAVATLMVTLPADRAGDRTVLFSQALTDYKQRPIDEESARTEDMGTFVVRFARLVPANMALEAIDELLKRAKEAAEKADKNESLQIVISKADKSAAFHSAYEYRLFQVLPALRVLDESRANSLLRDNQASKELMAKYPDGMQSIEPSYSATPSEEGARNMNMSVSSGTNQTHDRGAEEERRIAVQKQVDEIVRRAPDNPRQAIAQAVGLPFASPYLEQFRCRALVGIGLAVWKKDPMFAKSAADEIVKQTQTTAMHPEGKQKFLSDAIDLYMKLEEPEAAMKAIKAGTDLAAKLHESDVNADDPNKAIRPYWPSATLWRTFIVHAQKISSTAAMELVKGIDDPEIQLYEKISLANAWLGISTGPIITQSIKKDGQDTNISNSDN